MSEPQRITLELAKTAFREHDLLPDPSLYYLDLSPDPYPCRACLVGALAIHLAGLEPDEDGEIYEHVMYDALTALGYTKAYTTGLDDGFSNPSGAVVIDLNHESEDWEQGVKDGRAVREALLERQERTHDDE